MLNHTVQTSDHVKKKPKDISYRSSAIPHWPRRGVDPASLLCVDASSLSRGRSSCWLFMCFFLLHFFYSLLIVFIVSKRTMIKNDLRRKKRREKKTHVPKHTRNKKEKKKKRKNQSDKAEKKKRFCLVSEMLRRVFRQLPVWIFWAADNKWCDNVHISRVSLNRWLMIDGSSVSFSLKES